MMRLTTLLCLLAAACDKTGASTIDLRHPKTVQGGKVVARFGQDTLTDAELKLRFAEMSPYARARYQTLEQRKDYVDGVVRFELLAQEAARKNLQNDPEVVETARKVMVQVLLKQELETKPASVPDAQVAAYYERHKSDYVKPAMTRLAHVFFTTEHRAQADEALKAATAFAPLDYAAFAKLAREKSEEPRTQPIEGDLRFLSDDELAAQYGPELVAASKELTQVGQVLPHLVQTAKGFHLVKLQGRQVALNLTVDQVKTQIQNQLATETRMDRYRALLETLKKQSNYQLDESVLSAVEVDVKAPAIEAKGPTPGFLPAPEAPRSEK